MRDFFLCYHDSGKKRKHEFGRFKTSTFFFPHRLCSCVYFEWSFHNFTPPIFWGRCVLIFLSINIIIYFCIHIRIWRCLSFHHPLGYENYEMCISEDLYLSDCNYPPSKSIQINHESTQLDITRESLMWNHPYEDSFPFSHTLLTIVTSCSKWVQSCWCYPLFGKAIPFCCYLIWFPMGWNHLGCTPIWSGISWVPCVQDQSQLQNIAACEPQLLFEPKV